MVTGSLNAVGRIHNDVNFSIELVFFVDFNLIKKLYNVIILFNRVIFGQKQNINKRPLLVNSNNNNLDKVLTDAINLLFTRAYEAVRG